MSLLIKALQKAEQSKENAASPEKPATAGLALELAPHHDDQHHDVSLAEEGGFTDPLPKLAKAAPVVETPPPPPPAPAPASRAVEREAAANVFQAKTDAVRDPGSRRAFWLGIVGLALLLFLGGGFYVYLESLQQPELVAARPPQAPVPATPPAAPAQTVALPAPPAVSATANTPVAAAVIEPKPAEAADFPAPKAVAPVATPAAAAESENDNVKITRNRKSEPASNATAVAAYQAFMAGDDNAAGRLYRQLLQADSRSVDALLGLAAVSARQNKPEEAASHYARALEFEPRNSVAQAGLIALMSQADPVTAESKLKSLLAQQPDAAFLHAALGSVYAEQNQWPSAQQSYFEAFRLEPGSAEHAYNLAISLDQMAKQELALDYYQRSRDLLPQQGGSIDRGALESRINQLRSALGK